MEGQRRCEGIRVELIVRGEALGFVKDEHHMTSPDITPHALSHTTHNTTHRERTEKERRRERKEKAHVSRVFFVCDGVGAVDLPQRVHIIRFSLQFKALFQMLTLFNM